jgi:coproporphyrinogen III oxidase-like Fe-S oxidoreductase
MTKLGVNIPEFRSKFGKTPEQVWPESIARFVKLGLLDTSHEDCLRLTEKGVFLANDVMAEFI